MLLPDRIVPFPEDEAKFYQALGLALTRWQHVETALFMIAFFLMRTDHKSCSTAFFHIKSAENKLSFVDKIVFQNIEQHQRQKYWKPISTPLQALIDFRNALAHFEVFILTDDEMKKIRPKTKYRYILATHHLDPSHGRGGSVKALSVEGIERNADATKEIVYRLIYFLIDHIPQTEQQAASLEPRLQLWLDSFRKSSRPPGFEPPRKPSHPRQKKPEP